MSKKLTFIIVLVVLLAGLGLALVLIKREEPVAVVPAPELPPVEYVYDHRAEEYAGLASVAVKNEKGEFLVLPGDPPTIPGWETVVTNTYPLTRIVDIGGSLVSRGLVVEEAEDLSIYGLDQGRALAEITMKNGDQTTLCVGNDSPDRISVYVRLEGSPQVYQVGRWEIESLLQGIFDFVDLEVSPQLADDGSGVFEFSEILLGGAARPDGVVRIIPEDPDQSSSISRTSSLYRISSPVDMALNLDKGLPILQTIPNIRANSVAGRVSGPRDLALYGLEPPYSTATINGTLGQGLGGFTLRASRPDAEGNVNIYREGSELVYRTAAAPLTWLSATWWDLMDKMIILPFIDEVARVEVLSPHRQVGFDLSGEGDDLKVEHRGVVLNTDDFRKYYQTLLGAVYDEYAEEGIPPGAQPILEIVYHYRNGQNPDRVSFYTAGSRRVLTSFNGRRPFYTYSAYTDWVLGDLDRILAGEKVQAYL
jgi:hypothetical protein